MTPKNGSLSFTNEGHKGPDGRPMISYTVWQPVGTDSYTTARVKDGVVSTERVMTYKRVD